MSLLKKVKTKIKERMKRSRDKLSRTENNSFRWKKYATDAANTESILRNQADIGQIKKIN